MVVVGHEALGLQFVDEPVLLVESPVEGRGVAVVVPPAVEPDAVHAPVVGQQFGELLLHKLEIPIVVLPVGGASRPFSRAPERIVGPLPVEVAIIKMQRQPLFVASVGQIGQHVVGVGRAVDDVVGGSGRLEHGEAVVVTRGECDILRPSILEGLHPFVGIELRRIEAVGQMAVFLIVDVAVVHHPFALSQHGVDAPMEEDAEFLVLKLLLRLLDFRGRLIALCGGSGQGKGCRSREK